eukprot:TRINITY_DN21973_c0_g1_i1.p3 TRINITY_DN21973_c0_g1~~TRINITY_DN21973_c0_g1_i1.p3  ORF type:complete len:100 (-),score=16.54 TRINITY_DN21973_c0_g1_i1:186-485(-)
MVQVTVEFSGGMDLIFGGVKETTIDVPTPQDRMLNIVDVMVYCRDNLLQERPELFMKGDTVRPGILVLINDADWELSGLNNSEIEEGDRVVFISTLHGG